MKKIFVLSVCTLLSVAQMNANVLDTIAAHIKQFGRWDPQGVASILEKKNQSIDQQIGFLKGSVHVDFENPPQPPGKKGYERTPEEISAELIITATGSIVKAASKATPKIIANLEKQKQVNNQIAQKMPILLHDYRLQVKVVKDLREIAAINDKMAESLASGKKAFTAFRNAFRKGKRGVLKSRIFLALGFNKKEVVNMLSYSEPRTGQTDKQREKNLQKVVKQAQKTAAA